jgi:hypothetical protein
LVTALRIPKGFLGFEDSIGEGKNLALLDVRFARTINRIQQAIIQELNKIAIIHLYILGFHDELNNFKLLLNNPSTQGKMLMVEQWKEKVLLYKDLVTYVDGGIAPTSHTWAKKNIFNWSADEIRLDLEQQRIERAAGAELEATSEVITKTGLFDKIDKLYGEIKGEVESPTPETEGDETGGGFEDMGGDTGFGGGFEDMGGDTGFGADTTDTEFGESFNREKIIDKLLLEGKKKNLEILNLISGVDEMINKNKDEKDLSE